MYCLKNKILAVIMVFVMVTSVPVWAQEEPIDWTDLKGNPANNVYLRDRFLALEARLEALEEAPPTSVDWSNILNIPADLADGDDFEPDTQLSEAEVDSFVDNNGYLTSVMWGDIPDVPADIADGDDVDRCDNAAMQNAADQIVTLLPSGLTVILEINNRTHERSHISLVLDPGDGSPNYEVGYNRRNDISTISHYLYKGGDDDIVNHTLQKPTAFPEFDCYDYILKGLKEKGYLL